MGKIITPKYRLILECPGMSLTPFGWSVKDDGKPTAANLEKYVMAFAKSLENGGANAHLRVSMQGCQVIPYPKSARIETNVKARQVPQVMATWKAAMFQVF